ncbi:hypothetical protein [Kribbella catacumbae]|uniref:hypothetical protein n=1 Tax=Kribbella catacumbae TaxID=460086 RepID=UPI000377AED7|nr:hypothetical protein [Kribbella catacumbae]
MDAAAAVELAGTASEAIRALNHATQLRDVPAPVAYELLAGMAEIGYRMDQLAGQIGVGLLRSPDLYDVYDTNRDPKASQVLAEAALIDGARHVYMAAERFAEAQAAISGQGNNGRLTEGKN